MKFFIGDIVIDKLDRRKMIVVSPEYLDPETKQPKVKCRTKNLMIVYEFYVDELKLYNS